MRYRYHRYRSNSYKFFVTAGVIAGIAAAALGVFFAIRYWSVGRWILGGIASLAVLGFFLFIEDEIEKEIQTVILWLVAVANAVAGCIWQEQYGVVSILVAVSCATAPICVVCRYMEDWDIFESFAPFLLMPGNLMVVACVFYGISWLSVLYSLAGMIAISIIWGVACWLLDESCAGRTTCKIWGRVIMNFLSLALVVVHIFFCWKTPHFVHAMEEYPVMLAHRLEGADGLCSCGETIEVDGGLATWIHSASCDRLKPSLEENDNLMEEPMFVNREYHWSECACGFVLWQEAHVFDENGACVVCHWVQQEQPAEEPNPEEQETQEQEKT